MLPREEYSHTKLAVWFQVLIWKYLSKLKTYVTSDPKVPLRNLSK